MFLLSKPKKGCEIMKKRITSLALIVAIIFCSINLNVFAKPGDLAFYSPVFDATYYLTKYPELGSQVGTSPEALLKHFVNTGMAEGRQGNEEFDVFFYKNKYKDLSDAFGNDLKSYYLHYISCGQAEGRKGSASYSSTLKTSVSNIKAGDTILYGHYEQDGNLSNGKEPIEWIVLNVENGRALVISKYVLDVCRYYIDDYPDVCNTIYVWGNSNLRYYMNNDFKNAAFTPEELANIPLVTIQNPDASDFYSIFGEMGEDYTPYLSPTQDQIFALSYQELLKYSLGPVNSLTYPCWGYASPYFIAKATPYTESRSYFKNGTITLENCNKLFGANCNYPAECIGMEGYSWYLRTPGYRLWRPGDINGTFNEYVSYVLGVDSYGTVSGKRDETCASKIYGYTPACGGSGVRPAMYINL